MRKQSYLHTLFIILTIVVMGCSDTESTDNRVKTTSEDNASENLDIANENISDTIVNSDLQQWKSISAGYDNTAGIKSDGTLWTWGRNNHGQLGNGTTIDSAIPVQEMTRSNTWRKVSVIGGHIVALKADGTLWTWGRNTYGQLGDGTTIDRTTPIQESTHAANWNEISAGRYHTVAIKSNGTLWSWGWNKHNRLGQDLDEEIKEQMVPAQENTYASNWLYASAGSNHTVAIKIDGTLWGWGNNYFGNLGDGTNTEISQAIQEATKASDWIDVSAGRYHTMAKKSDGTLWLWGSNEYSQLGDGTETNANVPIQENSLSSNWNSISAGNVQSMATKDDGTLWGWGSAERVLGRDNARSGPTQEFTEGTEWSKVSSTSGHIMVIDKDNTLWGWGDSTHGEVGNGSYQHRRYHPVQIVK
jgi:alpha-tubulin suppressor-like RCC1 family protein